MAKSKSKKVIEEEEPVEVDDADMGLDDAPIPEDDEPTDLDVDIADEPADADGDIEEEPAATDDEPDERATTVAQTPAAPKAKITKTTIILLFMNWLAVPAFMYFAYVDHVVRTQYAYRTMLNYITVWGLPFKGEEDMPLYGDTRPRLKLSPEQLSEVVKKRTGKTYKDLLPVEEPVPLRLRPSDMIPELQKDVFDGVGPPVATLDDEIDRLKADLPKTIDKAAKDVVDKYKDKDENTKRAAVAAILLPLAWDVWQVQKLNDKLTQAKAADLDALLEESVERRLYYDILAPINIYRPADVKNFNVEKISDLDIEQVKKLLQQRLDAALKDHYDPEVHIGDDWAKEKTTARSNKGDDVNAMMRDSVEKRQKIAFILFTLSQVQKPELNERLYAKGIERAQTVCGLHEFTNASIHYVRSLRIRAERIAKAVIADREGELTPKGSTSGFIRKYESEIDRLVKLRENVDTAQARLDLLTTQRDHFEKIYLQRAKQHADILDQLLKARKNTEQLVKDLRTRQEKLHAALVELSDAADRNFQLKAQIRAIEMSYMQKAAKKGGKK